LSRPSLFFLTTLIPQARIPQLSVDAESINEPALAGFWIHIDALTIALHPFL